jgi:hypothetical protein
VQIFRSQAPTAPDQLPAQLTERRACYRVPLDRLKDATNLSTDALSRQTEILASYTDADGAPVLFREVVKIPERVDAETGEILPPHRELWLGPGKDPAVWGGVLARLNPKERKAWGGRADRGSCPDHPGAGTVTRTQTIMRTRVECAACARVLIETDEKVGAEQVERRPAPMPQDAGTIEPPTESGPSPHTGILRHRATAPPSRSRLAQARAYHAALSSSVPPEPPHMVDDPGPLYLDGLAPVPIDRHTDVSIGARP